MTAQDEKFSIEPKTLISEAKVLARVAELGAEITKNYQGKEITALCILKGSFVFFSDIIRHIDLPLTCEFLGVSSYGDKMVSSGEVKLTLDLNDPIEGKHIIIFEDIVDSGLTLNYIINTLKARKPATIQSCSLLMKPTCLKVPVKPEYVGFEIADEFVVGYGIDYAGKFRGLPYIGFLEKPH